MIPRCSTQTFVPEPQPWEGQERIEAALSTGLQQLAEIKTKWDPDNVFRTNRNIIPS